MYDYRRNVISRYGTEDGILVEFDIRQLEVAALAEIAKDQTLIDELNSGVDIHRRNAAVWKHKDEKHISKEERFIAKTITFQMQYGASAKSMARSLDIPEKETILFMKRFYSKYVGVAAFHNKITALCKQGTKEKVETMALPRDLTPTGREYILKAKTSAKGFNYISTTEGKNYPVQGFATGDLFPTIVNIFCGVEDTMDYVVNTVHDSILLDIPVRMFYTILSRFEYAISMLPIRINGLYDYELKVRFDYDISYGNNWMDLHELSRDTALQALHDRGLITDDYKRNRHYST
jgi:DNA polymerase-1